MLFCGIDTSNYTTSVALCDHQGNVVANIKIPLPVKYGDRGLRQSEAVFAHIKNFPILADKLKVALGNENLAAVAVSSKPRDVEDSYMPCFLSGVSVAEMLAAGAHIPIYKTSHQQGHIMAAYATSGASKVVDLLQGDPFVAFHISGGTTECLMVQPVEDKFDITLMGATCDLNAGQAIDRIGVLLGLKFPCGMEMEKIALRYEGNVSNIKTSVKDFNCNFSGLENIAQRMIHEGATPEYICAYVFEFIAKSLLQIATNVRNRYTSIPIIWAGGVMSNSIIKNRLSALDNVYFTEPQYSSDNAVGVSLICRQKFYNEFQY